MKPFSICLWFDSEAEEAAKFYTSIFKDGKIGHITHFGKEGFEHHGKPAGSVLTVDFVANGQNFVAVNGGPHFKFNSAISLMVFCETQKEIDEYWEKLTAGGGKGVIDESSCLRRTVSRPSRQTNSLGQVNPH